MPRRPRPLAFSERQLRLLFEATQVYGALLADRRGAGSSARLRGLTRAQVVIEDELHRLDTAQKEEET